MNRISDQTLEVTSVSDRVYEVIRDRILLGDVEGGSRLHQENISEELGVSRTPVREALARLASDGLVELLPNRGARVVEVTLEDMRSSYEARLAVEPIAARLAAERGADEQLRLLKKALAAQRRARSERAVYQAVRDFHLHIVDAAANPLLSRFAESLWAGRVGPHVVHQQVDRETLAADAEEHDQILNAIETGDGPGAEKLMRKHIEASLHRLFAAAEAASSATPERA
jgi:DNA-binding GntR family transcriptional regulator